MALSSSEQGNTSLFLIGLPCPTPRLRCSILTAHRHLQSVLDHHTPSTASAVAVAQYWLERRRTLLTTTVIYICDAAEATGSFALLDLSESTAWTLLYKPNSPICPIHAPAYQRISTSAFQPGIRLPTCEHPWIDE